MSILVKKPGLYTSVQDGGRKGYQHLGVGTAGAMDPRAMRIANILVGNKAEEAVLECTFSGPSLLFESDEVIALTGADFGARLEGQAVPAYAAVAVRAGQCLTLPAAKSGMRAYIAFAGGLDLPPVMGSRSADARAQLGPFGGRKLQEGDRLHLRAPSGTLCGMEKRRVTAENRFRGSCLLRAVPGPQEDAFTEAGRRAFWDGSYSVSSECDRMGARLLGPAVQAAVEGGILSEGVCFGSVQVPDGGQPIIMLADHQTTGGYAKIATVISSDFRLLGQLKAGDRLRFRAVTPEAAREAFLFEQKQLERLEELLGS